jgi:hypothetical protein
MIWSPPRGRIRHADVTVSAAEMLALRATPKVVVPAPPAGVVLLPLFWAYTYRYGGTPFGNTSNNGVAIISSDDAIQIPSGNGLPATFLTRTADRFCVEVNELLQAVDVQFSALAGKALCVANRGLGGTEWTLGNGTLRVQLAYIAITL